MILLWYLAGQVSGIVIVVNIIKICRPQDVSRSQLLGQSSDYPGLSSEFRIPTKLKQISQLIIW